MTGSPSSRRAVAPKPAARASFLRSRRAAALAAVAVALLVAFPAAARAAEAEKAAATSGDLAEHVGLAVGLVVLGAFAAAGLGCAVAVLATSFSRISGAFDRHARAAGIWTPVLVGSLASLGTVAVVSGAHRASPVAGGIALLVLGVPLMLAWLGGTLAVVPLLGERLLGTGGPAVSPLRRAVVGSVALSLASLPGFAFQPLWALMSLVSVGWPVGVALGTVLGRRRADAGTAGAAPAAGPAAPASPSA